MSAAENCDRQLAVRFLYWHLGQRAKSEHAPVELLADGTLTTFLTVGYVRRSLREMGERPCGETSMEAPILKTTAAVVQSFGLKPSYSISSTDSNIPMSMGIPALTIGRGGPGG